MPIGIRYGTETGFRLSEIAEMIESTDAARWERRLDINRFFDEHAGWIEQESASGGDHVITLGTSHIYLMKRNLSIPKALSTAKLLPEVERYKRELLDDEIQVLRTLYTKTNNKKRLHRKPRDPDTFGDKVTPYMLMAYEHLGEGSGPAAVIEYLEKYVNAGESPFIRTAWIDGQTALIYEVVTREGERKEGRLTRRKVSQRLNRIRSRESR
jgi:hypothetical protein